MFLADLSEALIISHLFDWQLLVLYEKCWGKCKVYLKISITSYVILSKGRKITMSVQTSLELWTAHFLVYQLIRKLSNTTFGPFSCLSSLSYRSSALHPHLNELDGVHWTHHTITYHCPFESIISNTGNAISHKAYSAQKSHL